MSEDKGFFGFLNSCISNLLSFLLAVLIALFVLTLLGWVMQVWVGKETSSEYFSRFINFYRHPEETALGEWARETFRRIRS